MFCFTREFQNIIDVEEEFRSRVKLNKTNSKYFADAEVSQWHR